MDLNLLNDKETIQVSDDIFACAFNEPLVHQVVTSYLAAGRSGTKAQKTRAEVRGGGIKPFKQKGTGRARAGTIRSPIWRKGGVTFAAKPRSFKQKVNKKMFRGAMCAIFSELIRQERLLIIDDFQSQTPKTKDLLKHLKQFKLEGRIIIVRDNLDMNLYLAARNLPNIQIKDAISTISDPVSLVNANYVVMTQAALREIEETLK